MAFDIDKLSNFAIGAIAIFAEGHRDETFYRFAIDDRLLCLNSIEQFRQTLDFYQNSHWKERYQEADAIQDLRLNTGDWAYNGFAEFSLETGFDFELHDEHYNIGLENPDDPELNFTPYALAMNAVLLRIEESGVLKTLRQTLNFEAVRVEHSY